MWPLERTQAKKVDDTRRTTDDGHSTITIAHSCSGEPKKKKKKHGLCKTMRFEVIPKHCQRFVDVSNVVVMPKTEICSHISVILFLI